MMHTPPTHLVIEALVFGPDRSSQLVASRTRAVHFCTLPAGFGRCLRGICFENYSFISKELIFMPPPSLCFQVVRACVRPSVRASVKLFVNAFTGKLL